MICNENNIAVHIDNHHLLLNYNADNIKIINDDNINKYHVFQLSKVKNHLFVRNNMIQIKQRNKHNRLNIP